MSNSVRPHRRQPTRLPHPWDSPGKNTGVGCHFLLQCMKVKVESLSCVRLVAAPWTAAYQAPPWDSPGESTGVGCHCFLCFLIKSQRVLNILGLAGHYNLCHNYSTLPLQHKSSHGQNINRCVWPGSNETLFIKTGKSHIWAADCNLPTSAV